MGRPLKFDEGFRKTALERLKGCEYIAGLAQELGISRSQLYRIKEMLPGASRSLSLRLGSKRRARNGSAAVSRNWNAWWRDRRWNWIFSKVPCCASRKIAGIRG